MARSPLAMLNRQKQNHDPIPRFQMDAGALLRAPRVAQGKICMGRMHGSGKGRVSVSASAGMGDNCLRLYWGGSHWDIGGDGVSERDHMRKIFGSHPPTNYGLKAKVEAVEITKDMSPFDKFKVDDRVSHITAGEGWVTRNNGEYICVRYDRPDSKRKFFIGEYDAGWFAAHPHYLFHRS